MVSLFFSFAEARIVRKATIFVLSFLGVSLEIHLHLTLSCVSPLICKSSATKRKPTKPQYSFILIVRKLHTKMSFKFNSNLRQLDSRECGECNCNALRIATVQYTRISVICTTSRGAYLTAMVSLQAVYLCPVLSVHLLKFIEVAFRLGDVLDGDVVTFGRERQVGRLVCNSAPHRRRRRPRSFGAHIQARLLHFGHDSGW